MVAIGKHIIVQNTTHSKLKFSSLFLYPQTQKTFTGIARITSEGIDGDTDKEITCGYVPSYIPTKQVCRDVTKYKEVTKNRTVIRYRTETVCD